MDNKVYIIKCNDYEDVAVKLPELLKKMGGIEKYASKGDNISLKVNLLNASGSDAAVTTHPAIVSAIGKMLKRVKSECIIVDSPGSGLTYNEKTLDKIYNLTGMHQAAVESGCKLNQDCSYREISYPEGKLIKRFDVISPVIDSDGVFNLCKMKTHMFMRMSGAVKNNFGVIPGLMKPGYHAKLFDTQHFADMLLDLAQYVSPRLTIMDAVVGMEGDGPLSGTPKKVGLLIASSNQLAVDVVAGEIMGLSRDNNPVLLAAEKRGMYPTRIEEVNIIGEKLEEIKIKDYKFPANITEGLGLGKMPGFAAGFLKSFFKGGFSARPVVNTKLCKSCRACYKACPVKAISMIENKSAYIDKQKCIRCYCCHEMCQEKAIDLKYGLIHKLIQR